MKDLHPLLDQLFCTSRWKKNVELYTQMRSGPKHACECGLSMLMSTAKPSVGSRLWSLNTGTTLLVLVEVGRNRATGDYDHDYSYSYSYNYNYD